MHDNFDSVMTEFSKELEAALAQPNRDDFIQFVGAAIYGLGVNGVMNDKLSLKVCSRLRIGEK